MNANNSMPQLLRLPDVIRRTGLSRSTLYSLERRNDFPLRVKLSPGCSAWSAEEVEIWINGRLAASRSQREG
jgi:prophage regulatory protein